MLNRLLLNWMHFDLTMASERPSDNLYKEIENKFFRFSFTKSWICRRLRTVTTRENFSSPKHSRSPLSYSLKILTSDWRWFTTKSTKILFSTVLYGPIRMTEEMVKKISQKFQFSHCENALLRSRDSIYSQKTSFLYDYSRSFFVNNKITSGSSPLVNWELRILKMKTFSNNLYFFFSKLKIISCVGQNTESQKSQNEKENSLSIFIIFLCHEEARSTKRDENWSWPNRKLVFCNKPGDKTTINFKFLLCFFFEASLRCNFKINNTTNKIYE